MTRVVHRERGNILTEFVITLPVLVFLLTATYEFSSYLHTRLILEDIAYEGARAGSQMSVEALPEGCFSSEGMQYSSAQSEAVHLVLSRVRYLVLQQQGSLQLACRGEEGCTEPVLAAEVIKVQGQGQTVPCGRSSAHENTFAVRVEGEYVPRFFSAVRVPITIEKRAYILANNTTFSTPSNPTPGGSCGGVTVSSGKSGTTLSEPAGSTRDDQGVIGADDPGEVTRLAAEGGEIIKDGEAKPDLSDGTLGGGSIEEVNLDLQEDVVDGGPSLYERSVIERVNAEACETLLVY